MRVADAMRLLGWLGRRLIGQLRKNVANAANATAEAMWLVQQLRRSLMWAGG